MVRPTARTRRAATLLLAGLASTIVCGCGYTARDEYFAARSLYVSSRPGTGEVVAFGRPLSEREAQRVASRGSDTPIGGD